MSTAVGYSEDGSRDLLPSWHVHGGVLWNGPRAGDRGPSPQAWVQSRHSWHIIPVHAAQYLRSPELWVLRAIRMILRRRGPDSRLATISKDPGHGQWTSSFLPGSPATMEADQADDALRRGSRPPCNPFVPPSRPVPQPSYAEANVFFPSPELRGSTHAGRQVSARSY